MSSEDMDFVISSVFAREIIDSRGNPTVEVDIRCRNGSFGRAAVPSGASTGTHEALELRDSSLKRYGGKGVLGAVNNVNGRIAPEIVGLDIRDQNNLDFNMLKIDGTTNKTNLGANAILGVSLAAARCRAQALGQPLFRAIGGDEARTLPVPMLNLINGGRHAGNELAIQEFMVIPSGTQSFREALRTGVEIYRSLRDVLHLSYGPSALNVGDEGGYAPPLKKTREALDSLVVAIEKAGYILGGDVFLGLDSAASNFYVDGQYRLDGRPLDRDEMIDLYIQLSREYRIKVLEDPLHEDDFEGFASLTRKISDNSLVVGDDLFVTNVDRLAKGLSLGAGNALLLKVNQIGTLTEAREAADLATGAGYAVVVSHRSGETTDDFIADLAVGVGAPLIKTGAPARGERVAKYNQLLRIEESLGQEGAYAGTHLFR